MSGKRSCKSCGSFDLESDPCLGDTVCTQCGVVLEDSVIISEVQFEENAHGGSSAIGQFVSSDAKSAPLSVMGPYTYGAQKESREITMMKARAEINRIAQQLRISEHCQGMAANFYNMSLASRLTKGRRSSVYCASCLYIACRLERTAHLLIDFSDLLQVDPFFLGRTFTAITKALFITLPIIDPCVYVLRYANQMNLGDKTQEVSTTALRVLKRMKTDFLHCGRRPSGLCGSALIIAARFHKIRKKLKDIVNIVHIQEVTLKKRLIEFGDTPSSLLTTEEFFSVDLGEQQDPPSFKAARLKDKERLQKFTDVQYEMKMKKLQRLIEKELDKKRGGRGNRSYSVCSDDEEDSSREMPPLSENADSCDKSKLLLADIVKNDIEDESEVVKAVVDSTIETIDTVCTNLTDKFANVEGGAPAAPETTDSTGNVVDENSQDATSFLVDSSLSDLDEDEIDSYIVTEEQFKQKEEAWMKLNQVYLEEQKKKEEERRIREKEEGQQPEKKKKRPKKQNAGLAATAGEAAEKVLREKKISNKLNYDVLKSLNINDFVKSMNFAKQIPGSGSAEVEQASSSKTSVTESTTKTLEPAVVEDEEPMEQDDYYDEADDFDEQDDDNVRGESVSKLLRKEFIGDEDYDDEDYDEEYD